MHSGLVKAIRMPHSLSDRQIAQFITEGFLRIDNAFPASLADRVVDILWKDIPFERTRPETWTEPVVRLGMYADASFVESLNKPLLHRAYDQLVGADNWLPVRSVGTFPVRFPSSIPASDTGKHVDVSFPGSDPSDYFSWRSNLSSRGRGLLILALYSDVSGLDAPTVIYPGSHADLARLLSGHGEEGMSFTEIAASLGMLPERPSATATGERGTVYLCHPFLVHAAQTQQGGNPRFIAQPPLRTKNPFEIRHDALLPPVAEAIRLALVPG